MAAGSVAFERSLCHDQSGKVQTSAFVTEEVNDDRVLDQRIVETTTSNLTQHIDVTYGGDKSEVESPANRRHRPIER